MIFKCGVMRKNTFYGKLQFFFYILYTFLAYIQAETLSLEIHSNPCGPAVWITQCAFSEMHVFPQMYKFGTATCCFSVFEF